MSVRLLRRQDLGELFGQLASEGLRVVGPTIRDGAIVYDELEGPDELPVGWTDEQAPGRYRLVQRGDDRAFGYVVGPHSWKRYLFPPHEKLLEADTTGEVPSWKRARDGARPTAFLGVRACELRAIEVQDRVFLGGPYRDGAYGARRAEAVIVAVNCTAAGELCFCASMDAGPRVDAGFDLCLTERDGGFLIEAGTPRGQAILERLPTRAATSEEQERAESEIEECRQNMGRRVDTAGLPELLLGNLDHPRWDEVAQRCLACANCTMVCPTCFCFTVDDVSDLSGATARTRSWDSCFTSDHSRIHGAEFRPSTKDRYRQWLTHKLSTWHAQFGTSGCVGCGRCIAWCPPGIDLTEEVAALRADAAPPAPLPPCPEVDAVHDGDPLVPHPARVAVVRRECADVVTLALEGPPGYEVRPGQFNMLALPGIGDVPISVSGREGAHFEHTIRAVGAVTEALCRVQVGEHVGVRGPFGSAWPLEQARGRKVLAIAGGIGLAPLRGALRALAAQPEDYPEARLIYGARTPADLLYSEELAAWREASALRVAVTVDRPGASWTGNVGTVLSLIGRKSIPADGFYWLCGPEVMMVAVLEELSAAGVPPENVFLSMERNMKCAAGFCGRCQYGPYFICKDGPVFRYDQVSCLLGRPGF